MQWRSVALNAGLALLAALGIRKLARC